MGAGVSLTEPERQLVEHVVRGSEMDLVGDEAVNEAAMRSWGDDRTVRAEVIRDILLGRHAPDPDPHGVRLRGARIRGPLDLERMTSGVAVELVHCLLEEGVDARGARLAGLALIGCRLEHPSLPPLNANRLATPRLTLDGASIEGSCETGTVQLSDARIDGQLDCSGASLRNESGPALVAEGLQVSQSVFLSDGFTAVGAGENATVGLGSARIGGNLSCSGASLRNESGPALVASRLQVDESVFLSDGFTAVGASGRGAVRLPGARIGGDLSCSGARLRNESGPALEAGALQVDGDVTLDEGFEAVGAGENGAVELGSARIGGDLSCYDASLRNESGPALVASRLQVDESVFLSDGFTAVGASEGGAVRLPGARIGGDLSCSGARLRNESGPALEAGALQVDGDVTLDEGFEAVGAGENATVELGNARIGGDLSCYDARLRNESGPAMWAGWLQVDGDVDLDEGFEAVGAGENATVWLHGARIGGELYCSDARLRNESGPALDASELQADGAVTLGDGFEATAAGPTATVHLNSARITDLACWRASLRNDSGPTLDAHGLHANGDVSLLDGFEAVGAGSDVTIDMSSVHIRGELVFHPSRLENTSDTRARLDLDRLTYSGLPHTTVDWLEVIRDATPHYAAQPYQQLASAHRAVGHDSDVRRVVMAQRHDQIHRGALTGRAERAWARLTGVTLGYGYQPWRALVALLVVVLLAVVLAVVMGERGGLARTDQQSLHPVSCSSVERIGVGLDFGIPLISTGARDRCDATDSTAGQFLTVASWGLQLLAWAFATLFVAGFTGAVRKT